MSRLWTIRRAGPALLAAACLSYSVYSVYSYCRTNRPKQPGDGPASPGRAIQSDGGAAGYGYHHAYPPDAFPGARDVETSYGRIRVYEWGDEDGDKVLLVHGMTMPCVTFGDLSRELARNGCRVMLFDLFGRGHSEAPRGLPFDERLYITQILHVLASSPLCWTGPAAFHILGYSLGGALATAFAAHHHSMLRSITAVCPAGIMRSFELDLAHRLCVHGAGWLPERLLVAILKRALDPFIGGDDYYHHRDRTWETLPLSVDRGFPVVRDVIKWQLESNRDYVRAYMGSFRHAPLFAQHETAWRRVGESMAANRNRGEGLRRMCLILASEDDILPLDWCVEDAERILGKEGADIHVLEGGHPIMLTQGREVANLAINSWRDL